MEPEKINKDLLKKIQENLKKTSPHGRWYGKLVMLTQISAIALLVFIATLAMSFFLYDLGEKTSIFEFTNSPIVENIVNFVFEFLIISLLGIGGIYAIYRQTDWPLVKERLWLLVGAFVFVVGISVGLVLFSQNAPDPWGDFIGDGAQGITHALPLRSLVEEQLENDMEENSYFTGNITKVETSGGDIVVTVVGGQKTKTFHAKDATEKYTVGDKVIVKYGDEDDGDGLLINDIKRI